MATATREYQNHIGGEWVAGSVGSYGITNPATEETIGEAPEASVADADAAAAAARAALPGWKRTAPEARANLLQKLADAVRARGDDLLPLIMAETGATLAVGSALQVPQALNRFETYARMATADLSIPLSPSVAPSTPLAPGGLVGAVVKRQPVGVVACISPYNFPLVNMAGKIGPALATGNTIVMKPAPQDPLAIIELMRIIDEVGFPPGVVNLVVGSTPEVGQALVTSRDVDMVSFTGSTNVGAAIFEAGGATMKRLLLELGGKGACLVLDDADLDKAIAALVSVWGFHSGQICTAPTRAIVHRSKHDELVAGLRAAAPTLTIGPPESSDTVVGPVISAPHRDRVESYIQAGVDEGGELVVDGRRPADMERGYYVGPTLIAGCHNGMRVVREEIFGPVIVVVPFDDDEEGIALANDSDFGLYDYVFSEDTARAYAVAQMLEAGNVGINTAQRNHETAFGGWKMSGVGRDGGVFGMHAYTEMQSIVWPG
ncbi:MAG: aldehyde dehydrogenase family protein [Acidimicrobiia bacterium]|jgi:acyl-CoA reductase-like NAD-dependent aldehyde dehydrogenase